MSSNERLVEGEKDLRFWTNFGLVVAVAAGLVVILCHKGFETPAIAAYGAAVGIGAVLGFLFGIPGTSKPPVNINNAGAVSTGNDATVTSVTPIDKAVQVPPAPDLSASVKALTEADAATPPTTTLATAAPLATAAQVQGSNQSSNLEQVADWVTKLLLGGGLTQMQRIPPKIWQWSHVVAAGIIGDRQTSNQAFLAQQAFAAGLLVYGFILGFFAGYLITKLQLGKAIFD